MQPRADRAVLKVRVAEPIWALKWPDPLHPEYGLKAHPNRVADRLESLALVPQV
jgi:hypothetical protein